MPPLSKCDEWNLLQDIAKAFQPVKANHKPSPRDWQLPRTTFDQRLECELREVLIQRTHIPSLSKYDFNSCRFHFSNLCCLLDAAVNPKASNEVVQNSTYPRLNGLLSVLRNLDQFPDLRFDLDSGPHQTIFVFQGQSRTATLDCLRHCNNLLGSSAQKSTQAAAAYSWGPNLPSRRDLPVKDRALKLFQLLFQRLTCGQTHEVLLKLATNRADNTDSPDLQLLLSACQGVENWQEVVYDLNDHTKDVQQLSDLCKIAGNPASQGQVLSVTDTQINEEEPQLLGVWSSRPNDQPDLRQLAKQPLYERVASGMFKPSTCNDFLDTITQCQTFVPRYTPRRKMSIALELGYCLMDFFDIEINSKKINFLGPYDIHTDQEHLYLSFTSSIPESLRFGNFKAGHPVLLGFAKVLLELYDGENLSRIEINSDDWTKNVNPWFMISGYVNHRDKSPQDEAYMEAVLGCLQCHNELEKVDLNSPRADNEIRDILHDRIVQHLKRSLDGCQTQSEQKKKGLASRVYSDEYEAPGPSLLSSGNLLDLSAQRHKGRLEEVPGQRLRTMEYGQFNSTAMCNSGSVANKSSSLHHDTVIREFSQSLRQSSSYFPTAPPCIKPELGPNDKGMKPPASRKDFEVAIICALDVEYDAISMLFDNFWDEHKYRYRRARTDSNVYTNGRIGGLDIVLLLLPEMGKVSSVTAAMGLKSSYPALNLVILSGILGGIPGFQAKDDKVQEILLGDVLISTNLIQHDLGRRFPDKFATKVDIDSTFGRPVRQIRNYLRVLSTNHKRQELERNAGGFLEEIQKADQRYQYPGAASDRLYKENYPHKHRAQEDLTSQCDCGQGLDEICEDSRSLSCEELGCEDSYLVGRKRLEQKRNLEEKGLTRQAQTPSISFGNIGSGDTVLKCGEYREALANTYNILGVEMEGAGIWEELPCIIIKGVCDYADSHKNKKWQHFAAATSAAVVKAFLQEYIQGDR
ncbi:pfs domain-containing protein [Fusarium austroafricanum]|uniref:Pfs domain-containing protein n=1 Tax=Fusarium austroafricanum TaxID=2364996 RepID=A0A8H4P316_9HYPO|nr:pfs domain-containing protein [Fusarium austroafricanum]